MGIEKKITQTEFNSLKKLSFFPLSEDDLDPIRELFTDVQDEFDIYTEVDSSDIGNYSEINSIGKYYSIELKDNSRIYHPSNRESIDPKNHIHFYIEVLFGELDWLRDLKVSELRKFPQFVEVFIRLYLSEKRICRPNRIEMVVLPTTRRLTYTHLHCR